MSEDERLLTKAVSFLLGYPDEDWRHTLGSMGAILEDLPCSHAVKELKEAVLKLEHVPPLQLQEEYTRTFDFTPSTCLNLTYHEWEDRKERGQALARMRQVYERAGFSLTGSELPDYLPLLLELLSICHDESLFSMMKEYEGVLKNLASRLDDAGSVYVHCVRAFLEVLARPGRVVTSGGLSHE